MNKQSLINLKSRMLCEGVRPDDLVVELFQSQNPSGVKRGGLSSGGKMELSKGVFVNVPFYFKKETALRLLADSSREGGVLIQEGEKILSKATILSAPEWYSQKVGKLDITQILTAHNKQLAGAVFEDCSLFARGDYCKFCAMHHSLKRRVPELIKKSPQLFLTALEKIPLEQYNGLTLNGGMTTSSGRGMELIEPVVREIHRVYPKLPIAVEMTPPSDLSFIDNLAEAGVSSLMMNLECWDEGVRRDIISGKNYLCPRNSYLAAFDRALKVLGFGKVTTCFVVGSESVESLKKGIIAAVECGAIPSLLAGRYFEDVPEYPFTPSVKWQEFVELLYYTVSLIHEYGLKSTDQAGCVACRMCDMIFDVA